MNYKTRQPFPHAAYVEGQRNFTYFDRSLTSGLTDVVIESPGDFLYIDQASTGVVSVELNMRQGGTLAPILLAAGGSIECDFASFKLTASAQLNKTVRVVVGNGARIKGGANVSPSSETIQTVDGSRVKTDASKSHLGYSSAPAVAGNYAHVQLWNPAASGKNVYLNQYSVSLNSAGQVFLLWSTAALASAMSADLNPSAKKLGGTASVAELRYTNLAAYLSLYAKQLFYCAANTPLVIRLTEPLLIPPGNGFVVCAGTINLSLIANFETWEE